MLSLHFRPEKQWASPNEPPPKDTNRQKETAETWRKTLQTRCSGCLPFKNSYFKQRESEEASQLGPLTSEIGQVAPGSAQ